MKYCSDCGAGHECVSDAAAAIDREVEIERLRTRRDIEVARIQASAAKDIAETESEHSSEHAEGVAEGMGDALDALAGGDTEPEGEPIVIDATDTDDAEPEPEPEPDTAPPVIDVPEPATPKRSSWWDGYR